MCLLVDKNMAEIWFGWFYRNGWVVGTKYIYKEYHSVCPLVGIGTLPPPLSPSSVPLPPEPKGGGGGGAHSPAGEGLRESQFRRLEKKLSTLPTTLHLTANLWLEKIHGEDQHKCRH
jgi:hypothetical protein